MSLAETDEPIEMPFSARLGPGSVNEQGQLWGHNYGRMDENVGRGYDVAASV